MKPRRLIEDDELHAIVRRLVADELASRDAEIAALKAGQARLVDRVCVHNARLSAVETTLPTPPALAGEDEVPVKTAAGRLQCSVSNVYQKRRAGKIAGRKLPGGHVLISAGALAAAAK